MWQRKLYYEETQTSFVVWYDILTRRTWSAKISSIVVWEIYWILSSTLATRNCERFSISFLLDKPSPKFPKYPEAWEMVVGIGIAKFQFKASSSDIRWCSSICQSRLTFKLRKFLMETVLHKMWVALFKRFLSRPLEFFNTDKSSPLISINLAFTDRTTSW